MFVADAHCDTLYSIAIQGKQPGECTVTPRRLAEGGVGLQTFALFAGRKGPQGTPYADGVAMAAAIPQVGVEMLTGPLPEQPPARPAGIVSCEGGEMLEGSLSRLEEFHSACRLRMIALTWNFENEIGHPAKLGPEGGLKPFGFRLLQAMDERGILADTSHLNEAGFWDIFAKTNLPPLASHSCCKALCGHARNLTDAQIRRMIADGGYIGVNFYPYFLNDDGKADCGTIADHIDHICQLGGAEIVGFGSDFDGIECTPDGLPDAAHLPGLLDTLRRRGFDEETLEGFAGKNLLRYFERIRV